MRLVIEGAAVLVVVLFVIVCWLAYLSLDVKEQKPVPYPSGYVVSPIS